jgi:SAM-dependent methyltransferase
LFAAAKNFAQMQRMPAAPEFGLAHAVYRAFRPPYPEAVYTRIMAELAPPHALAVDLGAGTGLVSAALCRHFDRVIAVEPDAAMAAHLHDAAPRAELQPIAAEQLELPERSVDLICCANALYWMDGPRVLTAVGRWLRLGGVFAAWRYLFPNMPTELAGLFAEEFTARWGRHQDVRVTATGVTTFGAAYLRTLAQAEAARYLADLEARITAVTGPGLTDIDFELTLVLARPRA